MNDNPLEDKTIDSYRINLNKKELVSESWKKQSDFLQLLQNETEIKSNEYLFVVRKEKRRLEDQLNGIITTWRWNYRFRQGQSKEKTIS